MPNCTQKYEYLGPLEFFENENFAVHAPSRAARAPKIYIWTPKIIPDLWLSAVTPPYCTCAQSQFDTQAAADR